MCDKSRLADDQLARYGHTVGGCVFGNSTGQGAITTVLEDDRAELDRLWKWPF